MAWLYLVLAGFLEIGWPIGLKLGWTEEGLRVLWLAFAIACILLSGMPVIIMCSIIWGLSVRAAFCLRISKEQFF